MRLYIIRHGEPDYATDSLTENGKKQAAALADRLCAHGLDEIFSSPLGRAIETAEPTCERLKLSYKIEEWLSENKVFDELSAVDENGERDWSFGCQNTKLIKDDYTKDNWYTNPIFKTCASPLECYKRMAKSSDNFLERLGYKRSGNIYEIQTRSEKKIAAFCHHGVGTIWLSHLLNIPPHIFWSSFDIHHTAVTIVEFKNNPDDLTAAKCICFADISHI